MHMSLSLLLLCVVFTFRTNSFLIGTPRNAIVLTKQKEQSQLRSTSLHSSLSTPAASARWRTPICCDSYSETFRRRTVTCLRMGMKRPILDELLANTLFQLETKRVEASSEVDDKGRTGEPMAWSEQDSWANRFSQLVATNPIGYQFKQWVADVVAGDDYDVDAVNNEIDQFIQNNAVAMFSFTTCPFCRRAKDELEERGIEYATIELDELVGNRGNEIRAQLGRRVRRTSVPCIFVNGHCIGGCNDGTPGLLPLLDSGGLDQMLVGRKESRT